ncbi:TPA: hypothetical protein QDC59_002714 [Burkholderia cenocepacia]|nr:hypothetical protein [Burkholderia cenocepacia]
MRLPNAGAKIVDCVMGPRQKNGAFDLRFVNVGQVVDLVYGDALKVPHVISFDVLQDEWLASF